MAKWLQFDSELFEFATVVLAQSRWVTSSLTCPLT